MLPSFVGSSDLIAKSFPAVVRVQLGSREANQAFLLAGLQVYMSFIMGTEISPYIWLVQLDMSKVILKGCWHTAPKLYPILDIPKRGNPTKRKECLFWLMHSINLLGRSIFFYQVWSKHSRGKGMTLTRNFMYNKIFRDRVLILVCNTPMKPDLGL